MHTYRHTCTCTYLRVYSSLKGLEMYPGIYTCMYVHCMGVCVCMLILYEDPHN